MQLLKLGSDPDKAAVTNLQELRQMTYPGRGIFIGLDRSGQFLVQICWMMSRSEPNRNRCYQKMPNGALRTDVADTSKLKENADLSLIIYQAMAEFHQPGLNAFVVSNGDQTETVTGHIAATGEICLERALSERTFEPDPPNCTPRITGATFLNNSDPHSVLSILRRGQNGERIHNIWRMNHSTEMQGFGYCLITYTGEDTNPLPSFESDPFILPVGVDPLYLIRGSLNSKHLISVAMKKIQIEDSKSLPLATLDKYPKVQF